MGPGDDEQWSFVTTITSSRKGKRYDYFVPLLFFDADGVKRHGSMTLNAVDRTDALVMTDEYLGLLAVSFQRVLVGDPRRTG